MRPVILFLLTCLLSVTGLAQNAVLPADNDTLNFTHCLFEVPHDARAEKYEILISTSRKDFDKHVIAKTSAAINQLAITSGLEFGGHYYWKYRYHTGRQVSYTSPVYNFHIAGSKFSDSSFYRNRVTINKSNRIQDGYVALDHGVIIDRNGKTVWAFPAAAQYGDTRNLQLNKDGNITFTNGKLCYELDLQGNELWRSPLQIKSYTLIDYHHDIRKLDNGNFLCLAHKAGKDPRGNAYDIIFEISRYNEVKWLIDEETFYAHDTAFQKSHINSVMLDKEGKYLYISSRDISTITKVDVQTGKIVYSIGYPYPGVPNYVNNLFNMQHAVSILDDGNLLLFNNNPDRQRHPVSSVLIISQPKEERQPGIVWEYVLDFPDKEDNIIRKLGDAQPLDNGNILVCTGATNRTFEINRDKEIVWETLSEKYDSSKKQFEPFTPGYRADFTESLYPCRFIAYADAENVVIRNTGDVPDIYQIITTGGNTDNALQIQKELMPGTSISIPKTDFGGGNTLNISSTKNIFYSKILSLNGTN